MSLQRIMNEIKKTKQFANEEVLDEPRETLGGRLSRKRKAQADMRSLTEEYRIELLRSAVFVLVTGETHEQFVKIASEEMKFFSADVNQFYSDIASQVSPQLYDGKESNPNLLDVVSRVLETKALEVGILGYPMIMFKQEHRRVIRGKSEFISLVKQIISAQMGTEVIGIQAAKSILNKAIDMGHDAKTTPILLSVSDETELKQLIVGLSRLTKSIAIVRSNIEATTTSVRSALASVKSQLGRVSIPEVTTTLEVPSEATEELAMQAAMNMGAAESMSVLIEQKDGETTDEAIDRTLAEIDKALVSKIEENKVLTKKERKKKNN